MSSTTKAELPKFLNYKEEKTEYGYEAMIDFLLSYTLRLSPESYEKDYPILYIYARITAYYLIYGRNEERNAKSGYYIAVLSFETQGFL